MRTQRMVSSVERLGTDEVSALVRAVVTSLRPRWVRIDAYGRPADEVEEVRRRLAGLARRPGAIAVDVDDPAAVELLAAYAPWSADVEIGVSGPVDLLLEILDGETVILDVPPTLRERIGVMIDPDRWDDFHPRRSLVGQAWSAVRHRRDAGRRGGRGGAGS